MLVIFCDNPGCQARCAESHVEVVVGISRSDAPDRLASSIHLCCACARAAGIYGPKEADLPQLQATFLRGVRARLGKQTQ